MTRRHLWRFVIRQKRCIDEKRQKISPVWPTGLAHCRANAPAPRIYLRSYGMLADICAADYEAQIKQFAEQISQEARCSLIM